MSAIKNFLNRNFREPVVYARIAEMLRDGAQMVRVKYRNRIEARYYTGTGNPYNNCLGKRKRWTMHVQRFEIDQESKVSKLINLGLPWMDGPELDLLLDWDWGNVSDISIVKQYETEYKQIDNEIINVVRRLKPGQAYDMFGTGIHQDTLQPEGFLLNIGINRVLVPDNLVATELAFNNYTVDKPFDPKKVYVGDEKLIKRQHRPSHDLARWLEIKQVPSVEDDWVLCFTHSETAGAPVFYYSLEIIIDNKSMKAHPFYVTDLVNFALRKIRKVHNNGYYTLDVVNIKVTWNGETKPLLGWLDNVRRYPALLDEQPNLVYKPLQAYATYKYGGVPEFKELPRDAS